MADRFYDFSSPMFQFPSIAELEKDWANIPDSSARRAIAETHQYYRFHRTMIVDGVQSWSDPPATREGWHEPSPLSLSARAGLIASDIVIGTSIIECALRAHAEARGISLHKNEKHRTLGHVQYKWKQDKAHAPVIDAIQDRLDQIRLKRNDVHLFERAEKSWEEVLSEEQDLIRTIDELIEFFQRLTSP